MESWRRADVPVLPGSGPAPRLHDTATGELVLASPGPVATLYACGITPYDATHIGHAATYTAWDLLIRAWLDAAPETQADGSQGRKRYRVEYVQNVTDVDDPLLERAERDGEDWRELARRETQRYRDDMEALRVLPPDHLIGAVEALPIIEQFTGRMAERGALYNVDEDVYFAKSADPEFGALSGPGTTSGLSPVQMTELSAERGGDPDRPGKKDPLGRPGWHVECAAIATEYLGGAFDVQAGGSDLVFPHHEMSASHVRVALSPVQGVFARVYAHSGMVSYLGEKMSKSLGNLVFVSRLLADGVDPMAIRLALLAHHYRSDWEWTDAVLGDAQARLDRWRSALARARAVRPEPARADLTGSPDAAATSLEAEFGAPGARLVSMADGVLAGVRARLRDDLDAPRALTIVDHWANTLLARAPTGITADDVAGAELVSQTVDALLGIRL
jgi:L-cysteine:1D-myo-inositol 2-amino-2-deoxy-alpha-D-glucopyranoside ligase